MGGTGPEDGRIRLAGRVLQLSTLREQSADFAPLYARGKAELGHAECLCRTPALRLVIRCSQAGRYHLAGWPGEGERHAADCPFHKLAADLSGRSGYSAAAIRETDAGTTIRFDTALARNVNAAEVVQSSGEQREGQARRSVGLLGLLHWLWEESQLNAWHPRWQRRTWWICHSRLRQRIANCQINGTDMSDALYVVPPYRPQDADQNAAAFEAFRARLGQHGANVQRGLILGPIKDVEPTPYGARYALAHLRGGKLYASAALDERVRRSYRPAFSQAAAALEAPRVGLFLVERSAKGYLTVVDMAVMLVSSHFIPADSSHEVVMAHELASRGRAYVKPVRYDGTDLVFPDFVLVDVDPAEYVEVYGIRGREPYERRKLMKQALYQRSGATLHEWEVDGPLPEIAHPGGRGLKR